MPLAIVLVAIFSAVLLGDIQAASAKSPLRSAHSSEDASVKSAYSYPWCGIRGSTGGMACYQLEAMPYDDFGARRQLCHEPLLSAVTAVPAAHRRAPKVEPA